MMPICESILVGGRCDGALQYSTNRAIWSPFVSMMGPSDYVDLTLTIVVAGQTIPAMCTLKWSDTKGRYTTWGTPVEWTGGHYLIDRLRVILQDEGAIQKALDEIAAAASEYAGTVKA